ncbi:MAG: hemolysin family protein [Bryobacteraceae bacterium]
MTTALFLLALVLGLALVPVCFVQLLYVESLRLRAKEQPALQFFKEEFEDKIGLKLDRGALAFSLIKHALLITTAIVIFASLERGNIELKLPPQSMWRSMIESVVISMVSMLGVAHLIPQLLYRRTNGRWLLAAMPLILLLALTVRPLLALLGFLKSVADLGAAEEPVEDASENTEQQIEALITAGAEEGLIEEGDRKLIQSVVEFGDKTVREVMTPRPNIVAIDADASLEDFRKLVAREQYSRVPIYEGTIDSIIGFVHVRDLIEVDPSSRAGQKIRKLRRDIPHVPETKPVDDLLRFMQERGAQMVVVVDEYGQTAGLATMEDLVEEIVGEITDEHDPSHDVTKQEDGSYVVSGNYDLDHLKDLVQFRPDEEMESTTVGGLVTEWLGHVPAAGESVEREGLRIEVVSSDARRVSQVRILRLANGNGNGAHEKD